MGLYCQNQNKEGQAVLSAGYEEELMEHLVFYYGACFMGILCLISMLAVYKSNRNVLKDLKHPSEARNRWMAGFVQEYEKSVKENTEIHNPPVYVIKRMRGRKIGPWNIRQMKGISWGTFILSFLLMAMSLFIIYQRGIETFPVPLADGGAPAASVILLTGICMEIVLLGVRLFIGTGYQEEEIETNLLDYIENRYKEPEATKIIPMENAKSSGKREKAMRQLEQGILEAAAADSRYSHLLSKEETDIVKDVVKEFLS